MAPPRTSWKCPSCDRSLSELGFVPTPQSYHLTHQYLCIGRSSNGQLLGIPQKCLVPGCKYSQKCAGAGSLTVLNKWRLHYRKVHSENLSGKNTLLQLHAKYKPHFLPSPNMNTSWGSEYSQQSFFDLDPNYRKSTEAYATAPRNDAEPMLQNILNNYRAKFM